MRALHAEYYLNFLHDKVSQFNPALPKKQTLHEIDEEMPHIRQALDWSLEAEQRSLSVKAARDLERYQEAFQALPRSPTGSLPSLSEIQPFDIHGDHLQVLEQSGFCCDRRDQLSDANNAILLADESGQITAANFQAQQLSGYTLEALQSMKTHELGLNGANTTWAESPQIETHLIHRSGASVPVDALRTPSRQGQEFNLMYILRKREIEKEHGSTLVLEDPLTHLPNRQAFIEQLRKVISYAANHAHMIGILVLDVDGFNDFAEQKLAWKPARI